MTDLFKIPNTTYLAKGKENKPESPTKKQRIEPKRTWQKCKVPKPDDDDDVGDGDGNEGKRKETNLVPP